MFRGWQPGYYNLLTAKKDKKIHVFEVLIFLEHTITISLKKFSSNTIFSWYNFGIFYIAKFNYISGGPNKVKEMFWNIFDRPLY